MPFRGVACVALVLAARLFLGQSSAFAQEPSPTQPMESPPVSQANETVPTLAPQSTQPPASPTDAALPYRTSSTTTKQTGPATGWDDGFYIRSEDRNFVLKITGQLQSDYRWYVNPADERDIDQFVIRRARFGLEATMFKYYEFRFMPDFALGNTQLVDGYMNVHYIDSFQVAAGKFKQPFSYEQLIQDRFTPLMERSLIDQLVPARDVGIMFHGQNIFANRFDYAIAVSNGEQNGNGDTNNSKDLNGRLALRPFATWEGSWLERLQIGMSAGYGVEYEPVMPNSLKSPEGVTFFQFNKDVLADGGRWRLSPELAYFLGSFGTSAQYFHMTQRLRALKGDPVHVPYDGFYVQATYLLTGEKRTGYSQQISPLRPFDPLNERGGGLGAWELAGRVSRIQAGNVVFATGPNRLADPKLFSSGATEMTLGFNWYINKWARMQVNWEHLWFDQQVKLGPGTGGLLWGQNTFVTRLQFVF
jgi:phosphate-selective porin OprO/OprP